MVLVQYFILCELCVTLAYSASFSGEGTYYAATGAGACSFDVSDDDPLLVAAMNAEQYGDADVQTLAQCFKYLQYC